MKNFYKILFFAALSVLVAGCGEKGPDGPDGIEVSGVTLSENSLSIIKGGMSRLSYTVEPEDAEVSSVSWESSDPAVASVDGNGLVTAVEIGQCSVILTVDGIEAECSVSVLGAPVESISVSPETAQIEIGEELQLTATILPEEAASANVSSTA